MAIFNTQGQAVTLHTYMTGITFQNTMTYHAVTEGEYVSTGAMADSFVSNIVPLWIDCLSEGSAIVRVVTEAYQPVGIPQFPKVERSIYEAGTVVSEAMPSFVTGRILK